VCNYRPISLTCLVVKVLERIVARKIPEFEKFHNKLSHHQHGFRRGYLCQTQILSVVHEWAKLINSRFSTHAIFLDFSKAFDSVPHQRLLLKLDHFGIRGKLLRWIEAYLINDFN
jgi:hypothetical protein